ncbi:MAG: CBS domain-containing protein [Micropruina sp.]|nr:CBS domain-containing protein [Micropruina sp.]
MKQSVREVMTKDAVCIGEDETITTAAEKLALGEFGALPICGHDGRLMGMVTDRDIVVRVIARHLDPALVTAGALAEGKPITIGADDSLEEAQRIMSEHLVRRLPVIDGHVLVGMLSQADLARAMRPRDTGALVRDISAE